MGMEMEKTGGGRDEEGVPLPGFRFHPTDEELLGFYLRRKVEKKSMSIELIKQVDIYKYEPWDLPKGSNVGDREWYFFCKRGRKYRNSIRPNRVTGSGFWKATGIDRPVYAAAGDCIGLKKSLVYYRGCAGKGTKTDWMMHEFRLPPRDSRNANSHTHPKHTNNISTQEAEVWTLCRIFKRNVSYKRCMPDWTSQSSAKTNPTPLLDASSKTCTSNATMEDSNNCLAYISFQHNQNPSLISVKNHVNNSSQLMSFMPHDQQPPLAAPQSSSLSPDCDTNNQALKYGDSWDELRSLVEFAMDPFPM